MDPSKYCIVIFSGLEIFNSKPKSLIKVMGTLLIPSNTTFLISFFRIYFKLIVDVIKIGWSLLDSLLGYIVGRSNLKFFNGLRSTSRNH